MVRTRDSLKNAEFCIKRKIIENKTKNLITQWNEAYPK